MRGSNGVAGPRRLTRRPVLAAALITAAGAMAFTPMAWAANGTASVSLTGGSLSVSNVGTDTLSIQIGSTGSGALPTADWADATGSGSGWSGTLAVSALTYTGQWAAGTSPALASTSAGTYNGTSDGTWFKVSVTTAVVGTSVAYSYTSNYPGDLSGTGTATLSGGVLSGPVGSEGVTISFSTTGTYANGNTYLVKVGTQTDSMTLHSATAPAITSTGTTSPAPTYTGTDGTALGTTGLKFLTAAALTGMSGSGHYTAAPGVSFTPDPVSWAAATYSGSLTYSIATGP